MTDDAAPSGPAVTAHVVSVENNLVVAIARSDETPFAAIPSSKLEIGTQLAQNYRLHGCIDGQYRFHSAQRARVFATLCLEFVQALIERRLAAIRSLAVDEEFRADGGPGGTPPPTT
jgi:hypothetical protein